MATQIHQLSLGPLTAHSFNSDRSKVAICPNSSDVLIYSRSDNSPASSWVLEHTLSEHDKLVTSIDWAKNSNRIVTCSQDRNAYVWTLTPDNSTWKPTLVLLRLNRGATCVRWSPSEEKFAVASGARIISICSFESDNDWWVAKHIKRPLRSTVLSIDWHPNSVLIAAASADMKARVFSAFIKGVDSKPEATVWGERLPFGTVCGEWSTPAGGWAHDVAFSPDGNALAFVGHDSSLTVVYPSGPNEPVQAMHVLRSPTLPYVTLQWVSPNSLVAAGHDCQPVLFVGDVESGWKLNKSLDGAATAASKAPPPPPPKAAGLAGNSTGVGRLNNEAFNRFRSADARGASSTPSPSSDSNGANGGSVAGGLGAVAGASVGADGELYTTHQNTITSVRVFEGENGNVKSISTSGVDGRLCVFSVPAAGSAATGMNTLTKGVASIRVA